MKCVRVSRKTTQMQRMLHRIPKREWITDRENNTDHRTGMTCEVGRATGHLKENKNMVTWNITALANDYQGIEHTMPYLTTPDIIVSLWGNP